MLTIELEGARSLIDLLQQIQQGSAIPEPEFKDVLAANAFFIDFYSGWEGCSWDIIRQAVLHFNQPERIPSGVIPERLAEGFRKAVNDRELLQDRLTWLAEIDASSISERVLEFLPDGTPLEAAIHITVDLFNNGFAFRNEMGVSLLHGATDRQAFESVVTHELHHVGYRYWSEQDTVRQALRNEKTGRAVAVLHVDNLLSEGMANFYCSPGYVFGEASAEPLTDPYQSRLARLKREEMQFFVQAETVLALSLEAEAAFEPCMETFKTIALDMEEAMLPAGHYLGARMVQAMALVHPRNRILACIKRLDEFLPAYQAAARKVGGFTFNEALIGRFSEFWRC